MSQEDLPEWVDISDHSGQIRVQVNQTGIPRVELGIGTKAALEHMPFVSQTQLLLNRALGEYTTHRFALLRKQAAARHNQPDQSIEVNLTAEERLGNLYARTVQTRRRVQAFRDSAHEQSPATAGRKSRVYVEARHGLVTLLTVDEQCYASTPVESLAEEINEAVAAAVTQSAQAGGPLIGVDEHSKEG